MGNPTFLVGLPGLPIENGVIFASRLVSQLSSGDRGRGRRNPFGEAYLKGRMKRPGLEISGVGHVGSSLRCCLVCSGGWLMNNDSELEVSKTNHH